MNLHHDVRGQGPALVLLHGWAMHSGLFAPLVAALEPEFELHLVDLPGHGRSRDAGVPLALDAAVEAVAARVPGRALWSCDTWRRSAEWKPTARSSRRAC